MKNKSLKKILIFCMSYYPRFVGGAEVAVKEVTDRIRGDMYEFHLVTLRYDSTLPRYEKIDNVHVYRIGFSTHSPSIADLRKFPLRINKFLYQVWAPCFGWWLHRRLVFDGVWSMLAHSAGIPARIFVSLVDVPMLVSLQEGDPLPYIEKQMSITGPLFFSVFTRATHIVSVSRFLKDWAISLGSQNSNVSIIPNGVDTSYVPKTPVSFPPYIVVTTSRLVPKNGIDILIRAMAYVSSDVVLYVAGDGYQRKYLESLAKQEGVQERVVFLGQQTKDQVLDLLQKAHVFVRPSRSEGFGNSFLEAMACGVPVVATHVGGISDFLVDPQDTYEDATGLVCEVDDPQSAASCIMKYKENPALYTHIKKNGLSLVSSYYLWDTIARDYQTVFDKIIASE